MCKYIFAAAAKDDDDDDDDYDDNDDDDNVNDSNSDNDNNNNSDNSNFSLTRNTFLLQHFHAFWSPDCLLCNVYLGPYPEVKRSEHEFNNLPPSIFDVKNQWIYTSINHICLYVAERGNFTVFTKW